MKSYTITGPGGEIISTLVCEPLLFDLEHPGEYVIPAGAPEVQAVRIVLADDYKLEET